MFVKNFMIPKQDCVYVDQSETLGNVLEKMYANNVDGVPVVDGDLYVGIVTKYLIYKNFLHANMNKEDYMTQMKAGDIASKQEGYLNGEELFEDTLIALKHYPILAVVNDAKKFVGIVTRYDVLEQFQSAFGMKRKGVRIAFTSIESEGRIATFSQIADKYDEDIISLVTFDEADHLVRRIVMKVEEKENTKQFLQDLEHAGFRIIDIRTC
ncbi:CBS domain-containing protein [Bacillus kwashiorkori]|uniref:CBS domain-containing protein n=1 Tax=Bacillus kwashiorkori TaxID=1522318 RepID=UPI00078094CA|nr:CBS domain-containing protein [Bacillus kwashiorkori]